MTGKLARVLVGTCMTAALTVSGLAGSMPAAHANPSCVQVAIVASANVNLVCTGNNSVSIPITVNVYNVNALNQNDISLIETEIGNIIVGNHDTVILAALNHIADNIVTIVKCNNVQVLSGNLAITKVCS